MSDLLELYQEVVVEHGRRPRNRGTLEGAGVCHADGDNPLCGDQVTVYIALDEAERIQSARFEGEGCAISTASASLMTEAVIGLRISEASALFERFRAVMTEQAELDDGDEDAPPLGKLAALVGVRAYPMRVKCATLAWHTMQAALHSDGCGDDIDDSDDTVAEPPAED
jgi:nitrogen fixation NifU-like protein